MHQPLNNLLIPQITVIIPVFNDAERLHLCLDSLKIQYEKSPCFEVIVIDNGSTDQPSQETQNYDFVRFLSFPGSGSYAARNWGLVHAFGEVLAFTDADCIPAKNWLERGKVAFETPGSPDLLAGDIAFFTPTSRTKTPIDCFDLACGLPQMDFVALHRAAATANLWVRRSVFKNLGGFDGALHSGGDFDFCKRARAAGYRLEYDEKLRVHHPTRSRWIDLKAQRKRMATGYVANSCKVYGHNRLLALCSLVRYFCPPVYFLKRILKCHRLSPVEKLQACSIAVIVKTYIACQISLLLFTWKPKSNSCQFPNKISDT